MAVGKLGEKSQNNWWQTDFLAPVSDAFLNPMFPKTKILARYNGVKEAARLVHDDAIGVGQRVFHSYRLPAALEHQLHEHVTHEEVGELVLSIVSSAAGALDVLRGIAAGSSEAVQGPTAISGFTDWYEDEWIIEAARSYLSAFDRGIRCFPYVKIATK